MPSTALVPADRRDVAHLTQLDAAASEYVHAGVSPNTWRAFKGALAGFSSWCASVGVANSPADVDIVVQYLTDRAPQLAASTLALHLSALNFFARATQAPEPGRHPRVKALMKGIRYRHGRPPAKKRGLLVNDLKRALKRLPSSPTGLRDRAILLAGFAGVLRRSELAALSIDAGVVRAVFVGEGLEIHIGRSKGDQEGRGAIVPVPWGRDPECCPVRALQDWVAAADIDEGPIFRPIDRHGHILARQLTDRSIANLVKAAAGSIGLDPQHFSGHSLRRGGATSMVRGGAALDDLRRHMRHAKAETTLIYVEEAERFANTAARKSGL